MKGYDRRKRLSPCKGFFRGDAMRLAGTALLLKVGADLSQFDRDIASAGHRLGFVGKVLSSPFTYAGIAAAAAVTKITSAVVNLGASALDVSGKFEYAFAEVKTILDRSKWDTEAAQKSLKTMSMDTGQDLMDMTRAMYWTVSSGIKEQADATKVLDVANKASIAGLTDVYTSVDVITTVLNAYGLQASESNRVADVLFATVREGKTTFQQLAQNIGHVLPVAANFGVGLEQVGAALATMTNKGIDTAMAATYLRQIMVQVGNASDETRAKAEAMGVDFTTTALRTKGLVRFMADLDYATKGNSDAMQELFTNVRAYAGALALTGEGMQKLVDMEYAITSQTGAATEAYEIMADTYEAAVRRAGSAWTSFKETLGGPIREFLKNFLDTATEGVRELALSWDVDLYSMELTAQAWGKTAGKWIVDKVKWMVDVGFPSVQKAAKAAWGWMKETGIPWLKDVGKTVGWLADKIDWLWRTFKRGVIGIVDFFGLATGGWEVEDIPTEDYGFQHGGLVGGRRGPDRVRARLTAGEFVLNPDATAALWPLPQIWNDAIPHRGVYNDYSSARTTLNFPNVTGPVDRNFIRNVLVPEMDRAREIGVNRRRRGVR